MWANQLIRDRVSVLGDVLAATATARTARPVCCYNCRCGAATNCDAHESSGGCNGGLICNDAGITSGVILSEYGVSPEISGIHIPEADLHILTCCSAHTVRRLWPAMGRRTYLLGPIACRPCSQHRHAAHCWGRSKGYLHTEKLPQRPGILPLGRLRRRPQLRSWHWLHACFLPVGFVLQS